MSDFKTWLDQAYYEYTQGNGNKVFNDEIKKLKAENEKLNKLVYILFNRGVIYTSTNGKMEYVLSEELYRICKSEFKQLEGEK